MRKLFDSLSLEVVSVLATPGGGSGFNPASPCEEEGKATVKNYCDVIDLASDLGGRKVSSPQNEGGLVRKSI